MSESLLQQLLDARHFALDGDDAQFERLTKASRSLQAALAARPAAIIPAVLLGLDPEAPEDEPLFDAAEKALKAEWKTLRNHYTERPRTILQAIVLDACHQAALASPRHAAIAWFTAVDMVPLLPATTLHAALEKHWLDLGRISEELALGVKPAVKVESVKAPAKAELKAPAKTEVKPPARKGTPNPAGHYLPQIHSAMGPFGGAAPNPYWVQQHPQQWASEFAQRMSVILAKVEEAGVDVAETRIAEAIAATNVQLETNLQAMNRYMRETVAIQADRAEAQRGQQDVLWWSQALYSPSLRQSYRKLAPEVAALVMALDLSNVVAAPAPASVVHLLGETVARLPNAGFREADRRQFGSIVDGLGRHRAEAQGVVAKRAATSGRLSLLAFLESVVCDDKSASVLRARTGVSPEASIDLPGLAMLLFRAAQARALAEAV